MFEAMTLAGFGQQILAALVVLLFAGATILRIYLICPLHASLRELFSDSEQDQEASSEYGQLSTIEATIVKQ